jgi:hypothetical protein
MTQIADIATFTFSAGQLSPTFAGRRDQTRYYQGARLLQNMIPLPSGGVTRRPPWKLVDDLAATSAALIPFQSGPTKSYVISVEVDVSDVTFTIYKRSGGVTTEVHSFSSGISDQYDGWPNAWYSQSRDVMYITLDGGTSMKKLTRTDDTTWTFEDVQEIDGPWDEINLNVKHKMNADDQSGTGINIVSEDKSGGTVNFFDADDVGKLIRLKYNKDPDGDTANHWGCAIITTYNSATSVDADIQSFTSVYGATVEFSLGAASASTDPSPTKNWRLGALNAENGYSTTCAFHQNRLFQARGNRIFGSMANNFERHSPTVADESGNHAQTPDCAIDLSLLDLRAADISWLHSDRLLHVGTNDGRYVLSIKDGALDPTSAIGVVKQSNVPCAAIRPVTLDDTFYVRFDKQALLRTDYNFRRDRFEDQNLNLYSDQILKQKVSRLAVTTYPFNIIWCLLEDGTLASLTYDAKLEIQAWAIHTIDGVSITELVSLRAEDEKEVLYAEVTNDDASPATVHLLELDLTTWDYLETTTNAETKLLDCYAEFSDTDAVTGMKILSSKTPIAVEDDGTNHTQSGTVSAGGTFTLAESIEGDFHVGIGIDTRVETFALDLPISNNTQIGKEKGVPELEASLHRTGSMTVKQSGSAFDEDVRFRSPDDPVDTPPPLFTGQKRIPVSNITGRDVSLVITQEEEAPLTILALNYKVNFER